jgi:hypothetical protein
MQDRLITVLAAALIGSLVSCSGVLLGFSLFPAAVAGVVLALVSGLLAPKWAQSEDASVALRESAKGVGLVTGFGVVSLLADCGIGLVVFPSQSLLQACTGHWPFLVTAFVFVPILGGALVVFLRLGIHRALRHEG